MCSPRLAVDFFVSEGVNLNKVLETAQTGIAGALRNSFPEKYATFSEGMKGAAEAIELLKKKSAEFGLLLQRRNPGDCRIPVLHARSCLVERDR